MFIKTAKAKIIKVGALKDLRRDLAKDEVWGRDAEKTFQKIAAVTPIARKLR